jgi:hypothetical protein
MLMGTEQRGKHDQIAWEVHRRARVAVPAVAAGVLYELSSITLSAALKKAPTVGALQSITPAVNSGQVDPRPGPGTAFVKYLSHNAFGQIAGSVMAAISVSLIVLALAFLYDASRFRRPQTWPFARPLLIFGGIGFAVLSVAHEAVQAVTTHSFAVGHDFSIAAADRAINGNAPQQVITYLSLLTALAFAAGFIITVINAMRTGLISRPLAYGGCLVAVLFVVPFPLQIIIALWMLMFGILLLGRWPRGDPAAWEAGEARPWPSSADQRAQRTADGQGSDKKRTGGGRRGGAVAAPAKKPMADRSVTTTEAPPEPTRPAHPSSAKRKRKRGARR